MTEPYRLQELGRELDRVVRRALQRRAAVIDAQLGDLMPGQTLCVHDLPSRDGLPVVALVGQVHVLAPGEECDSPVRRVQHGPAPPDWNAVVDRVRDAGQS